MTQPQQNITDALQAALAKLEARVTANDVAFERIQTNTQTAIGALALMFTVATAVAGLFIGFQVWAQTDKLDSAVSGAKEKLDQALALSNTKLKEAEDRINSLVSAREITSVRSSNSIDNSDNIYGDVLLAGTKSELGQTIYAIKATFYVQFAFEGSTINELSAISVKYDRDFYDTLYAGVQSYSIEGSRRGEILPMDDAKTMVSGRLYSYTWSVTRNDVSCDLVLSTIKRLTTGDNDWHVAVAPIFKIASQPEEQKEYKIVLRQTGVFSDCSELSSAPGANNSLSNSSKATAAPSSLQPGVERSSGEIDSE